MSVAPLSHATLCDDTSMLNDNLPSNQPMDDLWADENADFDVSFL